MNHQLYVWLMAYKFHGWLDGQRDKEGRGIYDSDSAWRKDYAQFLIDLELAHKELG